MARLPLPQGQLALQSHQQQPHQQQAQEAARRKQQEDARSIVVHGLSPLVTEKTLSAHFRCAARRWHLGTPHAPRLTAAPLPERLLHNPNNKAGPV